MRAKPLLALAALAGFIGLGGLPCHWQAATPAGAQGAGVQEVGIALGEWSLTPSQITVIAGAPIHLIATNTGVLAHALAIEGDGFHAETDAIGSHQTAYLDVTLLSGIYDLFCPVAAGQHRALGQEGTLEARDAPASADQAAIAADGAEPVDSGAAADEFEATPAT